MTDAERDFAIGIASRVFHCDFALRGACDAFRFQYGYQAGQIGFDHQRAYELCELIVGLIIDEAVALREAAAGGVQ